MAFTEGLPNSGAPVQNVEYGLVAMNNVDVIGNIFACSSPSLQYPKLFIGYDTASINAAISNPAVLYTVTGDPQLVCHERFLRFDPNLCTTYDNNNGCSSN